MRKLKWPLMIISWCLLIAANLVESGWAVEILGSLAGIGLLTALCLYVTE